MTLDFKSLQVYPGAALVLHGKSKALADDRLLRRMPGGAGRLERDPDERLEPIARNADENDRGDCVRLPAHDVFDELPALGDRPL